MGAEFETDDSGKKTIKAGTDFGSRISNLASSYANANTVSSLKSAGFSEDHVKTLSTEGDTNKGGLSAASNLVSREGSTSSIESK